MAKKSGNKDLLNVEEAYSRTEAFVEERKKPLTYIGVVLILGVLGYFGWKNFITEPNNQAALDAGWKADYYFAIDSFDLAMRGDGSNLGLQYISSEYDGYPSGEIAMYQKGLIHLRQGNPTAAIDAFAECDFDDDVLATMVIGNTGDAYIEMNDLGKGLEYYEEAALRREGNAFLEPYWGMKAALVYEKLENFPKAAEWYRKLKDNYPTHDKINEIRKYLARVETRLPQ